MRLRQLISSASLAALLISIALWALSYFSPYYRGQNFLATAYAAHFQFLWSYEPWSAKPDAAGYPMGLIWRGFFFDHLWWPWFTSDPQYWTIHLPLWMPSLVFATFFAIAYPPYRRYRNRFAAGLCVRCGYDLRGNNSGVCSECGATTGA